MHNATSYAIGGELLGEKLRIGIGRIKLVRGISKLKIMFSKKTNVPLAK